MAHSIVSGENENYQSKFGMHGSGSIQAQGMVFQERWNHLLNSQSQAPMVKRALMGVHFHFTGTHTTRYLSQSNHIHRIINQFHFYLRQNWT